MLDALDLIDVPAYVIDRHGTLCWANRAITRLVGECVNDPLFTSVSPDARVEVEAQFARRVVGVEATSYVVTVIDSAGRRTQLHVHSAPLRRTVDGEILGFFGLAVPWTKGLGESPERATRNAQLTPRQTEVLRLLGEGLSTEAIATRLGVAVETARNHIRAVLRGLGVHSRLEAVVEGRERGLLDE